MCFCRSLDFACWREESSFSQLICIIKTPINDIFDNYHFQPLGESKFFFSWPRLKDYLIIVGCFSLVLNSLVFRTCSEKGLILRPQVRTGLGMWYGFARCYKCCLSVMWHQVGPSGQWWEVENNVKEPAFQVWGVSNCSLSSEYWNCSGVSAKRPSIEKSACSLDHIDFVGFLLLLFHFTMVEAKVSLFRFPRPALALHISPEYKKTSICVSFTWKWKYTFEKDLSTSLPLPSPSVSMKDA